MLRRELDNDHRNLVPIKDHAGGFTLLELLVVIILLVSLITVATVNIVAGQDGAQMKTSARQLVSVLRSARTRAITEGVEAGIVLGPNSRGIEGVGYYSPEPKNSATTSANIENAAGEYQDAGSAQGTYTIVPLGETIDLPEHLSLSLSRGAQRGLSPPRSILFYPDGSATGGGLVLSSPAGTMAINVNWLTGELKLDQGF